MLTTSKVEVFIGVSDTGGCWCAHKIVVDILRLAMHAIAEVEGIAAVETVANGRTGFNSEAIVEVEELGMDTGDGRQAGAESVFPLNETLLESHRAGLIFVYPVGLAGVHFFEDSFE